MRVRPYLSVLFALAFGVGSLLAHAPSSEAMPRTHVKQARRAKHAKKRPLPKVIEVRLKDKPQRVEALLGQSLGAANAAFITKLRLAPEVQKLLAGGLANTQSHFNEAALAAQLNLGFASLREMHGKAKTSSTKEAVKIEAQRMITVAAHLFYEGVPKPEVENVAGSQRGQTIAKSFTSTDGRAHLQLTTAHNMTHVVTKLDQSLSFIRADKNKEGHTIISRPYDAGGRVEYRENTVPDANGRVRIDHLTYTRLDAHGRPLEAEHKWTKIDPRTEKTVAPANARGLEDGWLKEPTIKFDLPPMVHDRP